MCLLNSVLNLFEGGKCLSISCKQVRAMLVLTFLLNGGLYQITFLCLFLLKFVLVVDSGS